MTEADIGADATDRMLLERISMTDRVALEALYYGYHGRLCRLLSRLTRRADVMEEIILDCFWTVWRQAGRFHGESRVSAWIMGIAYDCALRTLRQRVDELPADGTLPDGCMPAAAADEEHELRTWLDRGLELLTTEQRAMLELIYGMGCSQEDVAAIMECSPDRVKVRLFQAWVRLHNLLPGLADEPPPAHGA